MDPHDDTSSDNGSNLAVDYLLPTWLSESKPAYHFWSCLVQPLYEPLTSRALPAAVTLPLVCLVLLLLTWLGTTDDSDAARRRRHKRHARAMRRRSALWGLWGRLRSLPAYSILFAYIATGTITSCSNQWTLYSNIRTNPLIPPHIQNVPCSHLADRRRVRLPPPPAQGLGGRLVRARARRHARAAFPLKANRPGHRRRLRRL